MNNSDKLMRCFYCTGKGKKSEMIKKEAKNMGNIVNRYFHQHCHEINIKKASGNDISKKFIDMKMKIGKNESTQHKQTKNGILEGIVMQSIVLIDQFGEKHTLKGEYVTTELPILLNNDIPYIKEDTCKNCFSEYEIYLNDKIRESSIPVKKVTKRNRDKSIMGIKEHPCISCKFNTNYFKFIFDVGIVSKNKIDTVIEIYKTSKATKEKLLYCINNDIEIFEVNVKDVKDLKKISNDQVKCEKLWWDDNGKIHIADKYR